MVMRLSLATVLLSLVVGQARAGIVGTQAFADIGTPTVNTGDINTATAFTIGDLVSTSSNTGAFAGMPSQTLGSVTFDTTVPGSLSFGNAVFGTFTSTSITEPGNIPGSVTLYIVGNYTPGTYVGGGSSTTASFTVDFTQTPAHTGSISDSGTFATPPASPPNVGGSSAPEPSSVVLGLIGVGIVGACRLVRRRSARAAK
jgi:PEP-CTERM motif